MDYKQRKKEVDTQIWYYSNEMKTKVSRLDSAVRSLTQDFNIHAQTAMNSIIDTVSKRNDELQYLEVEEELIEYGDLCKDFGNNVVDTLVEKRKQCTKALNDYLVNTSKILNEFSYDSISKCTDYVEKSTSLKTPKTETWENYSNKVTEYTHEFNSQMAQEFENVTGKFAKVSSDLKVELSAFNNIPELEMQFANIKQEEQNILEQLSPNKNFALFIEIPKVSEETKEKLREGAQKVSEKTAQVWEATKQGAENFAESAKKVTEEVKDKAEARGWIGKNSSEKEAENVEKVLHGEKTDNSSSIPTTSVDLNDPKQSNPTNSAVNEFIGINSSFSQATTLVSKKYMAIEDKKQVISQDISFTGSSEDIDRAKADLAATLGKNPDIEIKENPDGSLNITYSPNVAKSMADDEKNILNPGLKMPSPEVDIATPMGTIPSTNSWGIDPVKDKVNKWSSQGKIQKSEDVAILDENGNQIKDTNGKTVYRKVVTFEDGTRVMLNPDGTEVPMPRLPEHAEEENPQISAKAPEKQEEPGFFSQLWNAISGGDKPVKAEEMTVKVSETVTSTLNKKIKDNRARVDYNYPYWGIWAENAKAFCWVKIKSYTNYQQGVSARATYDKSVRNANEASTWTLLMPEKFGWTLTHSWGAYKGWATPIAEWASNLAKGTTEFTNSASELSQLGSELANAIANNSKTSGEALSSAFSKVSEKLNENALTYMKFDQAKTYNSSNDRGISLDFEFALGPTKDSAQYLWDMIHNLIERSSPVKSEDSYSATNMQDAWGFIPPDLFSVEVIPPGGETPIWALYDAALVDISTNTVGPWLYPVGIPGKITLDLTFSSIAPTYSSNEPMIKLGK